MARSTRKPERRYGSHDWRPADENPDTPFVHRVVPYGGPLPRGPSDWRGVCTWLEALGICAREGRTLRCVPGHEHLYPPKRGRGRPAKAPPVR